ncbi:4Fe-4S dicluster domain-containing protein [Fusibacter ferrireducens]|nr:4Fe-4S dicluster domain-containing protein [Fusibacter ferrireducens]
MINAIKVAGVVGAGGAGFPSHVKYDTDAEYVIVNGAECEPLLQVDQQLMVHEASKMVEALWHIVETTGSQKGIIALKNKYHDAIEVLSEEIKRYPQLSLLILENVYPAGDEHYIVYEATGRVVPEGGIPIQVGAVVTNVETLINVYNALKGEPVIYKYVSIVGAVRQPSTYIVPVGTSLKHLMDLSGGSLIETYKVIDGGPMMGKVLSSNENYNDVFVKKTSKGFIILPEDHDLILSKEKRVERILKEAQTACCHCDLCTDLCPRYLEGHRIHPSKLMRIASYNSLGDVNASIEEAYLCCECGLCEQACVMNLQPWKVNIYLKSLMREKGIQNTLKNAELEVHPFRAERQFSAGRLIYRLDLSDYYGTAPLNREIVEVDEVVISNCQHIGASGKLVVEEGAYVQQGTLIFKIPEEQLGANIHSSISGKVTILNPNEIKICR